MSYCNSVVENFLLIHFSVDLIGDVKTIVTQWSVRDPLYVLGKFGPSPMSGQV